MINFWKYRKLISKIIYQRYDRYFHMIIKGFYTSPLDDKTLTLKSGNYSLKRSITFSDVNDGKYFLFELHIY